MLFFEHHFLKSKSGDCLSNAQVLVLVLVLVLVDTQEGSIWSIVLRCDQFVLIGYTGGALRVIVAPGQVLL